MPLWEIVFFNKLIRSCFHCGSAWGRTEALCETCFGTLKSLAQDKPFHEEYGFPVWAPFSWKGGARGERLIASFVHAQKGGVAPEAVQEIAGALIRARASWASFQRPIFVPAPSKKNEIRDHAAVFAQKLSLYCGGEYMALLKQDEVSGQKQKSAGERAKLKLRAIGEKKVSQTRLVVFVDDVITTGSTAQAAKEALGNPENFEVWALACRKKGTLV